MGEFRESIDETSFYYENEKQAQISELKKFLGKQVYSLDAWEYEEKKKKKEIVKDCE